MEDKISAIKLFGDLPIMKIGVIVTARDNFNKLPPYLGSTWRGLIGTCLQEMVCIYNSGFRCSNCPEKATCIYFELFEKQSNLPGLTNTPRGYIFYPQRLDKNRLALEITLFGHTYKFANHIIGAILKGQKQGIGAYRVPYEVTYITEILPHSTLSPKSFDLENTEFKGPIPIKKWVSKEKNYSSRMGISLFTPLRLRKKGVYLNKLDISFLFLTLVKRLEALCVFFNNQEQLEKYIWLELKKKSKEIKVVKEYIIKEDLQRYSNRQKRKVPLHGIKGEIYIENVNSWWWEWWKMAEVVHIGKGANMGLGKIVLKKI